MKTFWLFLLVVNLLCAYGFAFKGDMGVELINLLSVYVCWKEFKESD